MPKTDPFTDAMSLLAVVTFYVMTYWLVNYVELMDPDD